MSCGCNVPRDAREPRAAYVHVPFCARRCGYCNFTLVAKRPDLVEPYLAALAVELSRLERPRAVDTLFFGGGTPSTLSRPELEQLLALTSFWFPTNAGAEVSFEANPLDVTADLCRLLADCGVTRLSLGGQSFNDAKLLVLERDHAADDVRRAVASARAILPQVSLDLIFAAPGETLDVWQADLDEAVALGVDHVSTYGLTFERGTTFWSRLLRGGLVAATEDLELQMYEGAIERLKSAGFEHYEVSNFARAGARCRHNEAYWLGDSYFAAGPGAARYVNGERSMNHRSTSTWIKRLQLGECPIAERETLTPRERAAELLVFGLRRLQGVTRADFEQRAGCTLEVIAAATLPELIQQGLLSDDGRVVRLTRQGLLLSDAVCGKLLKAAE